MRYIFLLSLSFFITDILPAQIEKEPIPTADINEMQLKLGNSILGKVTDLQNNKGIEAASV